MRIKLLLTAASVIAAMAFGASAAQADNVGMCQFDGVAGTASNPVDSVETDMMNNPDPTVDTDSGPYEFGTATSDEATCVKVDSDMGEATLSGHFTVDIVSSGTYENTVCGTGTAEDADGSGTTLTATAKSGGAASEFEGEAATSPPNGGTTLHPGYEIEFTAGQGVLSITDGDWDGRALQTGEAGEVTIVPEDTDENEATVPCVDEDVAEFTVNGAFTARAEE